MFWTDALAQAPAAGGPDNRMMAMLVQMLPLLVVFLILYLLMIRPQQQRQKQLDLMLHALKKGDRVITSGGLIGTVVGVDDARVTLKIADDVRSEFTKASIVQVMAEESK